MGSDDATGGASGAGPDASPPPGRLLTPAAIEAGYDAARRDLGRFNLGLFGLTGAGKSTLLNAVFGVDLAPTGIGAPVTQSSHLYRYSTTSLGIFDTKGLELGSGMADILRELGDFVDANRLGPLSDQLHIIWYCVRSGDRRIQPAEADFIRKVAAIGIPVILVMTQTPLTADGQVHPEAQELAAAIRELRLPMRGDIFFVNALADAFAGVGVHGLDELLDWTSALAPEGVRNALAAGQRVNRRIKAERVQSVIDASVHNVQLKSFLPKRLGETWVSMFAEIATIYDIDEAQSRAVLESSDLVPKLRRLIQSSNVGLVLAPTVGVIGAVAGAATNASRKAAAKRRLRKDSDARALSASQGSPAAGGPPSTVPDATSAAPARFPDEGAAPTRTKVRVGWAASRTTRALGEAWAVTCESFWQEAYPEPPRDLNVQLMADRFADELQSRLPSVARRWEQARARKQSRRRRN